MHAAIGELDENYPEISDVILHERNLYMAEKIKRMPYENIVVVIGAAYAPGMIKELGKQQKNKPKRFRNYSNQKRKQTGRIHHS